MRFRRSDQREAYGEAMQELSEHGESPERLAREPLPSGSEARRPAGFYGELNWEWEGAQRGTHAGKGPKGYRRSDERIREDVNEALERDGDLDASEITVDVKDGEVLLEGTVSDRRAKRLAEDLAEELPGVRDVHNRLRIAP